MQMADLPHVDATAIFPPLTANEARVLQVLTSARELSAETIAERTGLGAERAQRALGSLASRRPPLVHATATDRVALGWQPAKYSVATSSVYAF